MKKVIIVIPVQNPEKDFVLFVRKLVEEGFEQIVIVNDGSDESYESVFDKISKFNESEILLHCMNRGKGRAIETAINHVLSKYEDVMGIITVDADGQHILKDTKKIKEALVMNTDKLIMGCRTFGEDCGTWCGNVRNPNENYL